MNAPVGTDRDFHNPANFIDINTFCPSCGEMMELDDSGSCMGKDWHALRCPVCGFEDSDEPDFDVIYNRD